MSFVPTTPASCPGPTGFVRVDDSSQWQSKTSDESKINALESRIKGIKPKSTTKVQTKPEPIANCYPHNLSLEDVIEKVMLKESAPVVASKNIPVSPKLSETICYSRPRSKSLGSVNEAKDISQLESLNLMDLFKPTSRIREGTPESDLGYGTSVKSSSPDDCLLDLVNSMKVDGINERSSPPTYQFLDPSIPVPSTSRRTKLSSISEQDPAVAQAVKSEYDPNASNNLLANLFGYYQPAILQSADDLFAPHLKYPANQSPTILDNVARMNRNAASFYDATCTWSGQLPVHDRTFANERPLYSSKVFLGGVPWEITEKCLVQSFCQFGNVKVEWPGKGVQTSCAPKGYVYIVFESEMSVPMLLEQSTRDFSGGGSWFYRISSKRIRSKDVQVIPWRLADSNFVLSPSTRLDPNKTVFVGALHGMLTAEGLAHVFNDLFGGVMYAGIDTDRFKYPIGSGRVTFNNSKSYMKAVAAAFVEIKAQKFSKKVQVDPYLEDRLCSVCGLKQGPYFCRELTCFTYFCRHCWELVHANSQNQHHRPLMRNSKEGPTSANRPLDRLDIFMS